MLLIGEFQNIPDPDLMNELRIYNLSSFKEGFEPLGLLPPTNGTLPFKDEKEFDIAFANYIMQNNFAFMELMKVIISLYEGHDVFIVVSSSPYLDMITESLTKFIQVRYGYLCNIINNPMDIELLNKDQTFSTIQGLYNLDIDKERYTKLAAPMLMNNGVINYGQ